MIVFLAVLVLVGLCVLGLGVNVFFRKKGFPEYDVGSNGEMKKRGIRCFKDEDADMHRIKCSGNCGECSPAAAGDEVLKKD